MPKKYEISKEAQVLLRLLRIALGTKPLKENGRPVEPFPECVDWAEVKRLACEQNVSALAADGLNASGFIIQDTAISDSWIDEVLNIEINYNYYLQVLATLCQIFVSNGLKPIILKGYGLSLDYPIPSHRGVGDIDIYLIDENGKCAAGKGDEILENQLGLKQLLPDKSDEHHSVFVFKGINIENHHELVSTYFDKASDDSLRQSLFSVLKPVRERNESPIFFPSATFNAVYLLQHLYAHFYFGMMKLRQFTDLATFLNRHHSEIDWQEFSSIVEAGGLKDFSKGINGILKNYFRADSLLQIGVDNILADRLVHDIFNYGTHGRRGIRNLNIFFKDRWHYKYFHNSNWFYLTVKQILKKICSLFK